MKSAFQAKNWSEFKNHLRSLDPKRKGDSFEQLTLYYLKLDSKYRTKFEHVWLLKNVPHAVRKRLNLPSVDEGIDLVAKTHEGQYWVFQCKYLDDESETLTLPKLATFTSLAFVVCRNVSVAMVCTTANRYSRKLTRYKERLTFCTGEVWRALDEEFFRSVRSLQANRFRPIRQLKPRPHQRRAIQNADRHFVHQKSMRGKMIQPCGTGKTLTAYWIADRLNARTILIAVPSLALIRQSLEVWTREAVATGRSMRWICVCSDESIKSIERDDPTLLTHDLGIDVYSDPNQIAHWLRKRHEGVKVVFVTYQSGKKVARAARQAAKVFDLGIMDEAHKTVGKKGNLFGYLLHDGNIRIKKRLFMTATERRYVGRGNNIVSMDDSKLFGDTFELLTFKEALDVNPPILSDYKIVTITTTHDEVKRLIKKNVFVSPDKGRWKDDIEAETLATTIAIRKIIEKRHVKRIVSFHSSIDRAKSLKKTQDVFGDAFPEYKSLDTYHLKGSMPTAKRTTILSKFRSSRRGLVTNARCLIEGVDVPEVDCVVFADPKNSTIDIVQAVGRALRRAENKKCAYVVIPVLVDGVSKIDDCVESGAFDKVLFVLRALASNDERIVEYFRTATTNSRRRVGRGMFEIEIPDGLRVDTKEFDRSVELRFWSRLARLAWRPFDEARVYVHSLGLRSKTDWAEYCNGGSSDDREKPHDIPASPSTVYKNSGWKGWGDWLGTGNIRPSDRRHCPFVSGRRFARSLNLKGESEWRKYNRGEMRHLPPRPDDIPANPASAYKDSGWKGWGDWIGTGAIAVTRRKFRPFKSAWRFAHSLKLKTKDEWRLFSMGRIPGKPRRPDDIPSNPSKTYKGSGWKGWGDWLGSGTIAPQKRSYRSFHKARAFARQLQLETTSHWRKYCSGKLNGKPALPADIPASPERVYKDRGWKNIGDWLGTGYVGTRNRSYRSFRSARAFARKLKITSSIEWREYCAGRLRIVPKLPKDIPATPSRTYIDNGWAGWGDWFGTGAIANMRRKFRPFRQARRFARSLQLSGSTEWKKHCANQLPGKPRRPHDIPSNPNKTYKDSGWAGYADWLGTKNSGR